MYYGSWCSFTLVFKVIWNVVVPTEGEHRIPKGDLKRDEHDRLDIGPGLFVIGSGKKSGND